MSVMIAAGSKLHVSLVMDFISSTVSWCYIYSYQCPKIFSLVSCFVLSYTRG